MILEVEPLLLDIALLRILETPDLKIVPGRTLMARVVDTEPGGRGSITIAGAKIAAQLPSEVRPGDELRLTVRDVSDNRVVLSMTQPNTPPAVAAQVPLPPLPDDAQGDGGEEEAATPGPGAHVLAVRYAAPNLGPVDLRFELDDNALRVSVGVAAGEPAAEAQSAADDLRDALAHATERTVAVTVLPRREPLDVYA